MGQPDENLESVPFNLAGASVKGTLSLKKRPSPITDPLQQKESAQVDTSTEYPHARVREEQHRTAAELERLVEQAEWD